MEKTDMASGEIKNGTNTIKFQNFDITSAYSDHHHINKNQSSKEKDRFNNYNKPVYKKIMNEWKILEKNLPESIYVRVFDERIDLLRAAIIGPAGTPYHDGLFFFDIAFPSKYPQEPPKIYYHAHGLRLNPNLYANGYVCLSIINTWNGSKKEKWIPEKSSILQLLVSIQGLVLNEEPYFNEPGYAKSKNKHFEGASTIYNEKAFILSCKTMIYTLNNPPQNFECFVFEHFRKRGDYIFGAIKAYRDGLAGVGRYQNDGSGSSSFVNVSKKFKADLENVGSELTKAFGKIGYFAREIGKQIEIENVSELKSAEQAEVESISELKLKVQTKTKKAGKKGVKKKTSDIQPNSTVEKTKHGILKKIIKWLMG